MLFSCNKYGTDIQIFDGIKRMYSINNSGKSLVKNQYGNFINSDKDYIQEATIYNNIESDLESELSFLEYELKDIQHSISEYRYDESKIQQLIKKKSEELDLTKQKRLKSTIRLESQEMMKTSKSKGLRLRWTPTEDKVLLELKEKGYAFSYISKYLGSRSISSCIKRIDTLKYKQLTINN